MFISAYPGCSTLNTGAKDFTAVLPIAGLYQVARTAKSVDLTETQALGNIAELNLSI
ncbi:hypothetical protein KUH03_08280 [Sphingobacterium sp. E70]|uniref:hypothetical protein n=1 Tax=Sphingobacterium sp. E70 TaxID=2853439 RepID=UPI00211C48B9|nr:hypothetical protein [Sphingobacterium sp. E70]ULT26813.1 hypothetical protein KUH03_08280 [Sphingobacterium sp. E70]